MTDREKLLAATVAGLIGMLVLYFAWSQYSDQIASRQAELDRLTGDIERAERVQQKGKRARRQLQAFQQQSLPADLNQAQLKYKQWLGERLATTGLAKTVKPVPSRAANRVYQQLTYNVTGRGTLPQLTEFLHDFYATDELHRIRVMTVKPIASSKDLDVSMTIDALVMPGARTSEVGERGSDRLSRDLDAYLQAIVDRNPFSPANRPPRLASLRRQEASRGRSLSFTVEAEDPDEDTLTFQLGDDAPEGAEIDPRSGRFQWRPRENGDYEFSILVRDDGLPAQQDQITAEVRVVDAPPESDDEEGVDSLEFAFVAGIVEVDGEAELMLNLRSEDQTKFLRLGDKVEVGDFSGVITRIDAREIEIRTAEGNLVVRLGESLADGRML
jgi:hypothetical protein